MIYRAPVHIITGSAGCQEKHDPWLPMPHITAFRSNDYGFTRYLDTYSFEDRIDLMLHIICFILQRLNYIMNLFM